MANLGDQPILCEVATMLLGQLCQGKEVFEFGSGGSTLWLASKASRLTSVEHDPEWYDAVFSEAKDRSLNITLILTSKEDIASKIKGAGMWNVVFVDCRPQAQRNLAIKLSLEHVRPGGWLVADDYDFPLVKQAIDPLRSRHAEWDVSIIVGYKIHPVRLEVVKTQTAFCHKRR